MTQKMLLRGGAVILLMVAGWFALFYRPNVAPASPGDTVQVVQHTQTDESPAPAPAIKAASAPVISSIDDKKTVLIPDDPTIQASLPDPMFDMRAMYKRLRSEPRDKDWATRSENGIKAGLAAIPYLARGDDLRVNCASTMCEVHGFMGDQASLDNTGIAMQGLQGEKFARALAADGLEIVTTSFGSRNQRSDFTIYAKRR